MDFSEKQMISPATIRGLCNRAEGERSVTRKGDQVSWWERGERLGSCRAEGEHVSVATGQVPPEKRGPGLTAKICKIWLHVSSCMAASGAWAEVRQDKGLLFLLGAEEILQPGAHLGWGGMRAGVATSSHIPTWGPVPMRKGARASQGTEDDGIRSQKGLPDLQTVRKLFSGGKL